MRIFYSLVICAAIFFANSCNNETGTFAPGTKEGYELAKYHCATCHSFTPAEMLDRKTWHENVLPPMAARLGIHVLWNAEYSDIATSRRESVLYKEWDKILDYYLKTAPQKLTVPKPDIEIALDSAIFKIRIPAWHATLPVKTVLAASSREAGYFFTSDVETHTFTKWDSKLNPVDSIQTQTAFVNINYFKDKRENEHLVLTEIGRMVKQNVTSGAVLAFDTKKPAAFKDTIARQLARPISTNPGDFNNDGLTDFIICDFGFQNAGGLYLYQQQPDGSYKTTVIGNEPGSTQAIVRDFNKDGWLDLMVLYGHDQESIRLYTNNKKGGFSEKILLKFPPVYGSTSFQLIDFNKDGIEDIIYTCGDNADVSQVFKPFHGIYIYSGKGNNEYAQSYFYQINGCTKAIATDFDNDGDLDIAAIAFYADYLNKPQEGFIFFEQIDPLSFKPHSANVETVKGRWLTMDVTDLDQDGDQDIILGNHSSNAMISDKSKIQWNESAPFIVLENKTK